VTTPRSGARPNDAAADTEIAPGAKDTAKGSGDDTIVGVREDVARLPTMVARGSTLGRYLVLDRLGTGGMGVVFAAYDPQLDRKVAVKVLQATSRSPKATAGRVRLLREAQALAKLSHPNVIPVYDVGTLGDDVFLAMEFIAGCTLRAWVEAKRDAAAFDWRAMLRLYIQAGRGLAAAHAAGIVHRDFKPENVMVDEHARARVLDFGLARPARDTTASSDDEAAESSLPDLRLTATGAVMGTPFYMSPEQHRGEAIDERSDQFSFCVALWEALYGQRPFGASSLPELARTVLHGELRDPPRGAGIPPWVRRALERGLATDPDARFASMDALLGELDRDPGARRRLLALSAGLVGVSTAAVAGVLFVSRAEPPCRDLGPGLDEVWNDAARESTRAAFVPLTEADGEAMFERTATHLDAYAREWSAERLEACEATRVRSEQSEQVLELRYACLDRGVYQVGALLDLFASADKEVVFQAPALVEQLPAVVDCSDIARLRSAVPPPSDPDVMAAVQDIRRQLAHIEALAQTGHIDQVIAQLGDLLAGAEATGYRPVVGEVLMLRGRMMLFAGDADVADAALERALLIGEAIGYDGLIMETCLWMASLEATRRNDFARAHRHLARADAVLERMGNPRGHRANFLLSAARVYSWQHDDEKAAEAYAKYLAAMQEAGREHESVVIAARGAHGHILDRLGRSAEAEQAIMQALAQGREVLGDNHPEVGAVLIYRARMLKGRGDEEQALAVFAEARGIYEKAFGGSTGNVGAVLNDEALALSALGRFDEALAKLERSAPIIAEAYGEENLQYASSLVNQGEVLMDMGRVSDALAKYERTIEIRARRLGKQDAAYAGALAASADARLELGQTDAAKAAYEEALAVLTRAPPDDPEELAHPEAGLGDVALAAGKLDDAERHYTHAATHLEQVEKPNDRRRARAWFGLARVMAARGDRDAALSLARQASEALVDRPDAVRHRAAIERWIEDR
jgi:tetratricopeptide (TPR) repeat protein